MKRVIYCALVLLCISFSSYGQVGIGTTVPRAELEIANTANGGILIPQYALSGNNDATTVVNPQPSSSLIDGTLVYNTTAVTGANALSKGFVYWDATTSTWNPLGEPAATVVYGEVFRNSDIDDITNNTALVFDNNGPSTGITLNSTGIVTGPAGVYRITYTVSMEQDGPGGSQEVEFFLRSGTTEIPGSRTYVDVSNNPDYISVTKTMLVDLTSANQTIGIFPDQTNNNVTILSGTSLSVELID